MKQRPIKPLVDALRELGAEINYLENEGFPPLEIHGKKIEKFCQNSSQYFFTVYYFIIIDWRKFRKTV